MSSATSYARLIAGVCMLNLIIYACRAGLAGSIRNDEIDRFLSVATFTDSGPLVNGFVDASVYSVVAGVAHSMVTFMHIRTWDEVTRVVAVGTGWLALGFTVICAAYASKQYDKDVNFSTTDNFDDKMEGLAALSIFQMLTQLLLLLLVIFLRSSQQSFNKLTTHGIV